MINKNWCWLLRVGNSYLLFWTTEKEWNTWYCFCRGYLKYMLASFLSHFCWSSMHEWVFIYELHFQSLSSQLFVEVYFLDSSVTALDDKAEHLTECYCSLGSKKCTWDCGAAKRRFLHEPSHHWPCGFHASAGKLHCAGHWQIVQMGSEKLLPTSGIHPGSIALFPVLPLGSVKFFIIYILTLPEGHGPIKRLSRGVSRGLYFYESSRRALWALPGCKCQIGPSATALPIKEC